MVVVGLEPNFPFMDRCGMATSTRKVAQRLWKDGIPPGDLEGLVRLLYQAENVDKPDPSGSQDMAGLIYPGINRLDYDAVYEGGYFPVHVESCINADVAAWLEEVLYLLPVTQRPDGYNPLGEKNLDPAWVHRLGCTGQDCYAAILAKDLTCLGESLNECMRCWEHLLPQTVRHPAIQVNLVEIMQAYQFHFPGAMYSGCGGGYLIVASAEPVPGTIKVKIRL